MSNSENAESIDLESESEDESESEGGGEGEGAIFRYFSFRHFYHPYFYFD